MEPYCWPSCWNLREKLSTFRGTLCLLGQTQASFSSWLNSTPARLNTYAMNRVYRIIERVPARLWRHVKTNDNPADVASRGTSVEKLHVLPLWWNGPPWLSLPPEEWPIHNDLTCCKEFPEVKQHILTVFTFPDDLLERFSSYHRMIRVLSWCRRFVANCKVMKEVRTSSSRLQLEEVESTEKALIHLMQQQCFQPEIKTLENSKNLPGVWLLLDGRSGTGFPAKLLVRHVMELTPPSGVSHQLSRSCVGPEMDDGPKWSWWLEGTVLPASELTLGQLLSNYHPSGSNPELLSPSSEQTLLDLSSSDVAILTSPPL